MVKPINSRRAQNLRWERVSSKKKEVKHVYLYICAAHRFINMNILRSKKIRELHIYV